MRLSIAVITFNEAKNIRRCLLSVKSIADEIIVIDSGSSDGTPDIAKELGAKVIHQSFLGHIAQKNVAWNACTHDLILSLDADEAIDDTLLNEIIEIKNDPKFDAYLILRKNNYCGKWIQFGAWRSDNKIRLCKKDKAAWGGMNPHDKLILKDNATLSKLKGSILHWSYKNIHEHIKKTESFARIAADAYALKGKKSSVFKIAFSPLFRFVRDYFFKLGFLDGSAGLIIAFLTAKEVYLKYKYLHTKT